MKLKSILLAAGIVALASVQTASATNYTLGIFQGPQANSHLDYYVNSGQGTLTYRANVGAAGNTGGVTFTNGNGSTYGSLNLTGNIANGNLSVVQDNGAPQFLRDIANAGPTGDSMQFSWKMLVGASDSWHINSALDSIQGQQFTGLLGTVGGIIDADYSAPFAQAIPPEFTGWTGGAVLFVNSQGVGDPRFNPQTPSCNGAPGCGGDNNAIEITGPGNSGQVYSAVRYDGVFQVLNGDVTEYHQVFSIFGQGAYTVNGTTITHFSLMPVQVSYISARIPAGGGGPAVPEPMTMSLLGGALGIGAIRRKFKKS